MNDRESAGDPPPGGRRTLIDRFPNGVIVLFDADLRYRIVGPDVLPFSGRIAADMVGKAADQLFPQATVDTLEPELHATIAGDSRSFDVEYDGRIHHVETRPTDIDGDPYGVLVTQSVTEERRTARQLEQQNERLDQFASMVSHDLRNPLSIATGRLELYEETGDDAHLAAVASSLERIVGLVTDLTALARNETPADEPEPVDIAAVARDAWSMIDSRAATLSTAEKTVVGYPGQLQVLFENLFRNSVEHGSTGSRTASDDAVGHGGADVTVRVGPLEDGFYVEDTGSGVPPAERDRVFEHGFTTGYGGSGVGLSIVGRIATTHGLSISLAESEEGGARFEFRDA